MPYILQFFSPFGCMRRRVFRYLLAFKRLIYFGTRLLPAVRPQEIIGMLPCDDQLITYNKLKVHPSMQVLWTWFLALWKLINGEYVRSFLQSIVQTLTRTHVQVRFL
jgi:hypothetical protein